MKTAPFYQNPEFDEFADDYDAALEKGIAVSGESKTYFAQARVAWLEAELKKHSWPIHRAMDFGCGTGTAIPYLLNLPGIEKVVGLEVSAKSLSVARRLHGSEQVSFQLCSEYQPDGSVDLIYCSGVFHHIPVAERPETVSYLWRALRPGGILALWENNPWNPGTRYVMSRIPFDRNAVTLAPPAARRLLQNGRFEVVNIRFLFIFPRVLRWFRRFEPGLAPWPLGAQYQVLACKPGRA